jgi:sugar lactone lactonase YvrE
MTSCNLAKRSGKTLVSQICDGSPVRVVHDKRISNGTLVIAETVGACLTAFAIAPDGKLTDRRIWADLSSLGPTGDKVLPDGIGIDADDGIWVSDPAHSRAIRIGWKGSVIDIVSTSQPCFAVGLSGRDGKTLICCTASTSNPNIAATLRTRKLEIVRVEIGRPQR